MKPTLQTFADPKAFKAAVYPLLLQHEARYCLGIGIINTLITDPTHYPTYSLASFALEGRTVGMAWSTPPYPLGMTAIPDYAIPLLVNFALAQNPRPTGVIGPVETIELFKEQWLDAAKCRIKSKTAQRIFELTQVNPTPQTAGAMRVAEERDLALLERWNHDFSMEIGLAAPRSPAKENAIKAIKNRSRFLWDIDGHAVAMAGLSAKTPNGRGINQVFTPPDLRGRGFASALVARLSQKQLDEGRRFCFLYTDLVNPVSNRIYQNIGYKAVGDSTHYTFQY